MSKSIVKASWQKMGAKISPTGVGFTYRRKTYWKCGNQCKNLHPINLGEIATKNPIKF